MLLEAHDLLSLGEDLVGDGGCCGLQLLVDLGDLLIELSQLCNSLGEIVDLLILLLKLLLVSPLLLLIMVYPVFWVLEAFFLKLLCKSGSLDADA